MYKEFETEISYKYLKEVIHNLKEPICIMGGWAVFFHVNHKFEKAQGRPYLGSRDIDLGFHMNNDLKDSTLAQTIIILKDKLNFKPLSFRFMKEIIEHGYLYIATPPLYLIKKGKQERYCWTEEDRARTVEE
ncbi:MAG: hypothetical protein KKA61_02150, partial [Nanoarchaeota archaeon]|nr:hypothetical protein [Nanoarchaeota archaeon]